MGAPARLVAMHEDIQPQDYLLGAEECVLGRASRCQIVVPRQIVSRLHAKICQEEPLYLLHDLSTNGTFINHRRIEGPHPLKHGDLIGLGSATPLLHFIDPDSTLIPASRLTYEERAKIFFVGEQRLPLTPTLFRLLEHLYQRRGEVCSREDCARAIWGPAHSYDALLDDAAIDRVISNLRAQLRKLDPESDFIETRRGLGFLLHG